MEENSIAFVVCGGSRHGAEWTRECSQNLQRHRRCKCKTLRSLTKVGHWGNLRRLGRLDRGEGSPKHESEDLQERELRSEAALGAFGTEKRPWRSIFATAVIFIFLKTFLKIFFYIWFHPKSTGLKVLPKKQSLLCNYFFY